MPDATVANVGGSTRQVYFFELTEEETAKAREWMKAQLVKDKRDGPIGARFIFCFTPSTIGTAAKVVDRVTKEEIDLTADVEW